MKPTETCHVLRSVVRALGADLQIDHQGLLLEDPPLPRFDQDTDRFRHEWLVYNLLRKREVDRPETAVVAWESFLASEEKCHHLDKNGIIPSSKHNARVLFRARQICHDVLRSFRVDEWLDECTFTGGASTSRRRDSSHPALKWWARPSLDVTPLALKHLLLFAKSYEALAAWSDPGSLETEGSIYNGPFFRVVPGSRLEFVEKNYKTKRAILIEPDGNMLLQKGVGNMIRKRLRRWGVNLNTQKWNQVLAYIGSKTGAFATIDLKAASDSVTFAILRLLLPNDWLDMIYDLRSHVYHHDGEWRTMRKVSSMGNGFTFELESLIFYCLTKAVVDIEKPADDRLAIFGDDIIVATGCSGTLISVLSDVGFETNVEKSFVDGPFRESCGKHYHNGVDVTPFYVKEDLNLDGYFRMYNSLRDWCGGDYPDCRYEAVLSVVLDGIPYQDRRQVPVEYGNRAGLWYADVCTVPVRHRQTKHGHFLVFHDYSPKRLDLTERFSSECLWLYQHMTGFSPSCSLGISVYTPPSYVVEGKRSWQRRKVAASKVMCGMP